jgi:hypothetical protein
VAVVPRRVRVTLRLGRGRRARRRHVWVESLSLERLLEVLRIGFARVSVLTLRSKNPPAGYAWLTTFTTSERAQLASLACPAETPRELRPWVVDKANMLRLASAMLDTNDTPGILSALNLTGKTNPGGGNIHSDVATLCRIYPGTTPPTVWGWYADHFFEACLGLRELERLRANPPAPPRERLERAPAEAFLGIPGVEVVM